MNYQIFYDSLRSWPPSLYSLDNVLSATNNKINSFSPITKNINEIELNEDKRLLMLSLAELYQLNKEYEKALFYLLKLKKDEILNLIEEFSLFYWIYLHFSGILALCLGYILSRSGGAARADLRSNHRTQYAVVP